MEVCYEGEEDEVGLYGMVWYCFFLFPFFSLFCASG